MNIEAIFDVEPESWLSTLPDYQKVMIDELYAIKGDYDEVAKSWLNNSISTTVPFGTQKGKSPFFEKILDELEAFFSGDPRYEKERASLISEKGIVQAVFVSGLSYVLSTVFGVAGAFLAPVIAIALFTITKIGINAWLASRKATRDNNEQNNED